MSERRDFIKKVALGTIEMNPVLGCKKILKNEPSKKIVSKEEK